MQTPFDSVVEMSPAARLAALTEQGLARAIATEKKKLFTFFDHLGARIENRIVERVLLNRIKASFSSIDSPTAMAALLTRYREAYSSGKMSTLTMSAAPAIAMMPAQDAPTSAAWANTRAGTDGVILYTPGGGFILPASSGQISSAARLGDIAGCDVLINQHAMAPEAPFPSAIDDTVALYRWLLSEFPAQRILIAADTAGASVSLGALLRLREQGDTLPAGLLLFSPWADLSMSGWSYITKSVGADSPFRMETAAFCAKAYLQSASPTDPLASAIYADLAGFPPLSIHTSEYDMHFDDALKLVENADSARVSAKVNYWDSPRHHLERFNSKEATRSLEIAATFVQQCLQLPQERKHG